MSFRVGDRVIVVTYDWAGTIIEIDKEDSPEIEIVRVEMDYREEIPAKKSLTNRESIKKRSVKLYVNSKDIKKIEDGSHDPGWKDIWDSGAT